MKRILSCMLLVAMFALMGSTTYASEDSIEISFKVGDEVLIINGDEVVVEMPFVENGTTLVPLRVITEAFGADVTWNGEEKSILLEYNDTLIKVFIGSSEALVDGEAVTMLQAPVIVNANSMVPLRFITENFGAEVGYDDATKQITVTKAIDEMSSITDYTELLKKTVKDRVGDSYLDWSVNLPDDLVINYRDFNGEYVSFTQEEGLYYLTLYVQDLEDETLDSILSDAIDYATYYTLIDQGLETVNDLDYAMVVYRDSDWIYEDRFFIDDDKVYYLYLEVTDIDSYRNSDEYAQLLDSFSVAFSDSETTEDLSEVTDDGYITYENSTMGWSIDIPANWSFIENSNKENELEFDEADGDALYLDMFSIEDGLTLQSWYDDELKDYKELYNPELVKVLDTRDLTINGLDAKEIFISFEYGEVLYYSWDIFLLGENYRYYLGYVMSEDHYMDEETIGRYDRVLSSFTFEEPDLYDIGMLIDPNRIEKSEDLMTISSEEYKWSLEIPSNWDESYLHNGEDTVQVNEENGQMYFQLDVFEDADLDEYVEYYEDVTIPEAEMTGSFTNISKDDYIDKGTRIYEYNNEVEISGLVYNHSTYYFEKNDFMYVVEMIISDLYSSEYNQEILESIWESLELE